MKRKTIFLSIMCGSIFTLHAGDYVRIAVNGGENGYNKVNEVRVDHGGGDVDVSIGCSDPGFSSCPSIVTPDGNGGLSANVQSICSSYALSQIGSGNLSGYHQMNISGEGLFYITWTSYDNTGRTSTITIDKL